MSSHSKKQHNFMEAIAHSSSFAKKAGVPQSVGKDYAAADKGKTFSKGSEMKESKGMVGKEVAFFKKKGAPKSMIKHEEAEMKGMKRGGKVRRMAEGGETDMSMGYGDPFAKPRDYEAEKEQGAKNLRGIKNFLGFGDKEEKPAPVESEKPSSYKPRPSFFGNKKPAETVAVPTGTPRNRTLPDIKNPESDDNERKPRGPQTVSSVSDRGEGELSGDGLSPAQGPKAQPKRRPAVAVKPIGVEKTVKQERVITEPVDTSRAAIEERRAAEKKPTETKPKSSKKFGLASDETRASVRKGLGSVLDFFDLGGRHEKEFGKKAAKGGQVKKMAFGGSTDDGMAMGQPMRGSAPPPPPPLPPRGRGMPRPAAGPEMNPNSIAALQAKYGMRPQGGPPMKAGGSVKKMAEGGFAKADGAAKKGKTEGKMVKMAAGGFVKSADGCAQRGKTKAFQVKMSRGGKC